MTEQLTVCIQFVTRLEIGFIYNLGQNRDQVMFYEKLRILEEQ